MDIVFSLLAICSFSLFQVTMVSSTIKKRTICLQYTVKTTPSGYREFLVVFTVSWTMLKLLLHRVFSLVEMSTMSKFIWIYITSLGMVDSPLAKWRFCLVDWVFMCRFLSSRIRHLDAVRHFRLHASAWSWCNEKQVKEKCLCACCAS